MQLTGMHHVTAVSANAAGNHRFYTGLLGMRLVKKTVNQDDTSAYHLFYADGLASPGTDMTFFEWPVPPARRGTRSIVRTTFRVAGDGTLEWWRGWFDEHKVSRGEIYERNGHAVLDFEDFEGQRLSLMDDHGIGSAHPVAKSPVPAERQIRGLGPVTLSVPSLQGTDAALTQLIGLRQEGAYKDEKHHKDNVLVYAMGEGGPSAELHVAVEPHLPVASEGAGGVHHLALRTPTFEEYDAWAARLAEMRYPNSGPVNRHYFRSLYFREPSGILIEIATDEPGFAVDEPMEALGEKLSLPPFLEARRASITQGLKPL
jgi:glyoxalase family protein